MKGHLGAVSRRLTYANVVATLALLLAVSGGTAYAASKLIKGSQIAKGTITAKNIKSRSLVSSDFKKRQIPAGAKGATGPTGPAGAPGTPGAAGSAIAYGDLRQNPGTSPAFNAGLSSGFSSVYFNTSTGNYCFAFPAGVTTQIPLEITDNASEKDTWAQESNSNCSGTGYAIADVTNPGTQLSTGEGLNIVVP